MSHEWKQLQDASPVTEAELFMKHLSSWGQLGWNQLLRVLTGNSCIAAVENDTLLVCVCCMRCAKLSNKFHRKATELLHTFLYQHMCTDALSLSVQSGT